jgi:hypothetical protein
LPTVWRTGPYRLFFYAGDGSEPEHIHVERDNNVAEFWLDPIRLERSGGFGRSELGAIQRLIAERRSHLIEAWHAYFQG